MNAKSNISLTEIKKKYETYKFTYRRLAYLIRNQLNDQIPQSLVSLIYSAIDVY